MFLATWGLWLNAQAFLSSVEGFEVVLGVAGLINATSGFLADAWQLNEMERHAGIGNMLFNAGTLVLLLWAVQEMVSRSSGSGGHRMHSE